MNSKKRKHLTYAGSNISIAGVMVYFWCIPIMRYSIIRKRHSSFLFNYRIYHCKLKWSSYPPTYSITLSYFYKALPSFSQMIHTIFPIYSHYHKKWKNPNFSRISFPSHQKVSLMAVLFFSVKPPSTQSHSCHSKYNRQHKHKYKQSFIYKFSFWYQHGIICIFWFYRKIHVIRFY